MCDIDDFDKCVIWYIVHEFCVQEIMQQTVTNSFYRWYSSLQNFEWPWIFVEDNKNQQDAPHRKPRFKMYASITPRIAETI
jgi:hypothetical protein